MIDPMAEYSNIEKLRAGILTKNGVKYP